MVVDNPKEKSAESLSHGDSYRFFPDVSVTQWLIFYFAVKLLKPK
jgi:hypothetical protein